MALGVPYSVCGAGAAAGSATLQVTAGTGIPGALGAGAGPFSGWPGAAQPGQSWPGSPAQPGASSTGAGDAIVVALCGGGGTGSALPASVSDSRGNTYVQAVLNTTLNPSAGIWVALDTLPLTAGTDWIMGSFSPGTSGAKELIARACSGVLLANALDIAISSASSSGTTPTSGSSGILQQSPEWAVAVIADSSGGGVPSSWTGGFTAVTTQGAGPYLTLADQVVTSASAITAGATIATAKWECLLVTLMATLPPVPIITAHPSAAVVRASWW